jgi:hypothetical protein
MPEREHRHKSSGKSSGKSGGSDARLAEAEARAAKAERELAALKTAQKTKEVNQKAEAGKLKENLRNTKTVASMNFNQDCVIA